MSCDEKLEQEVIRLRRDGLDCQVIMDGQQAEIVRLCALLRHADDVVIWEHTLARAGFQEEIEDALGIGKTEE